MEVAKNDIKFQSMYKKDDDKACYNLDFNTLSLFMAYVLCDNKEIKKSDLSKLRKLMDMIDLESIKNDQSRLELTNLVNRALQARLDKKLNNKAAIFTYIKGGILEDDIKGLEDFADLSADEIEYVNSTITYALDCAVVQNNMGRMKNISIKYDMGDYKTKSGMVEEIKSLSDDLHNSFRENESTLEHDTFSFDSDKVEDCIYTVYEDMTSPGRFLRSGLQGLNIMLGGGFESDRFYLILGNTGVGKSVFMLNMALQIRRANRFFKTKDPNKKPIMLFLTQENTQNETVDRLFQILAKEGKGMSDYTSDQVRDILMQEGHMLIDDQYNIGLDIVYRPDRSISTADLADMIDDYEAVGKEVICVFQDHIKNIRSVQPITDTRVELGYVVTELKNIAIKYHIPVLSVSHLNRDAAKIIDENATSSMYDLTRMLGRSNVGESYLMMNYADASLIIGREADEDDEEWMAFNLLKMRYTAMQLKYMVYPLHGIEIETDYDKDIPIYKTTLRPEARPMAGVSSFTQNNSSIFSGNQNFKSMDDLANDDGFGINSETFTQSTIVPIEDKSIHINIPVNSDIILDNEEDEENKPIEWVTRIV